MVQTRLAKMRSKSSEFPFKVSLKGICFNDTLRLRMRETQLPVLQARMREGEMQLFQTIMSMFADQTRAALMNAPFAFPISWG